MRSRLLALLVAGALTLVASPANANFTGSGKTKTRLHGAALTLKREAPTARQHVEVPCGGFDGDEPVPGQLPPVSYCSQEVAMAAPAAATVVAILAEAVAGIAGNSSRA